MLATLAAIQLLALTQLPASDAPPETPPAAEAPPVDQPSSAVPPASVPPRTTAAEAQGARPPGQLSLLSADPLRGGSAALGYFGWPSLGVLYGQGLTDVDDLGALFDFDWATTEMRLGAWYRRPVGKAAPFDIAGRLSLSWYADFGGSYIYSENHDDRGIELVPALVFSTRGAGGIFSLTGELPITITFHHGGGLLFTPRAAAIYEAPLYEQITVGARAGLGYRAGSGDAPISGGRVDVQFLVLAGYRIL